MIQPVGLVMAPLNVEHMAQISKDAIAATQLTAQGQEVVQESVRRTQMVQAGDAAAEVLKVQRRTDDEERERRREQEKQRQDAFMHASAMEEISEEQISAAGIVEKRVSSKIEFYA